MDHTLDRDDREAVALHTANLTPSTDSGEYRFGFGTFETAPSGPARTYAFDRAAPREAAPDPFAPQAAESFRPTAEPFQSAQTAQTVRSADAARTQAASEPFQAAFGGGAAVPPNAPPTAYPGGYGWPGWVYSWGAPDPRVPRGTVHPRPSNASAKKKKKPAKKQTNAAVWIVIAAIFALIVGLAVGALGYSLLHPGSAATAPTGGGTDADKSSVPTQIYQQYARAVVGVSVEPVTPGMGSSPSAGTGFIISADGYILTNFHVIGEPASRIQVTLSDGSVYPATLIGFEAVGSDAALLKIDAANLTAVSLGDSDAVSVGEPVCTIGNPLGELTGTLTVGYVSATNRPVGSAGNSVPMIQTDAALNNGNSGGPLFDFSGKVVGIVTTKYSGETSAGASIEGLGFALPINGVMDLVRQWQSAPGVG